MSNPDFESMVSEAAKERARRNEEMLNGLMDLFRAGGRPSAIVVYTEAPPSGEFSDTGATVWGAPILIQESPDA